jgi:transposase
VAKPTFSTPDLTTFCRLDTLDLTCTGQNITGHKAILECQPNTADDWCRRCGGHGIIRDTVVRQLAHEPFGHRPTTLHIRLRRYKCVECGRVWRQDATAAAPPRAKISRTGLDWALRALVIDHDTVSVGREP